MLELPTDVLIPAAGGDAPVRGPAATAARHYRREKALMDRKAAFDEVVRFHQHSCPGAAFGIRVAEAALSELGVEGRSSSLVLVSETDTCVVDALQVLTGCTFGKRNLIHEDAGRNVFTVWERGSTQGVRIHAVPGSVVFRSERIWVLANRIEAGTATFEDKARFADAQADRISVILDAPAEDILTIERVETEAPRSK